MRCFRGVPEEEGEAREEEVGSRGRGVLGARASLEEEEGKVRNRSCREMLGTDD